MTEPTASQIKYATDLLKKLGYDVADYDFDKMTEVDDAKSNTKRTFAMPTLWW